MLIFLCTRLETQLVSFSRIAVLVRFSLFKSSSISRLVFSPSSFYARKLAQNIRCLNQARFSNQLVASKLWGWWAAPATINSLRLDHSSKGLRTVFLASTSCNNFLPFGYWCLWKCHLCRLCYLTVPDHDTSSWDILFQLFALWWRTAKMCWRHVCVIRGNWL